MKSFDKHLIKQQAYRCVYNHNDTKTKFIEYIIGSSSFEEAIKISEQIAKESNIYDSVYLYSIIQSDAYIHSAI